MKTKFLTAFIFSALLLTACNKDAAIIDDIETSGTAASRQPVQVVEETTASEEKQGETDYILGGDTETAVSVMETTAETAEETAAETADETVPALETANLNVQKIDISGIAAEGEQLSGELFISGDIAAIRGYRSSDESDYYYDGVETMHFFDINDLSPKAEITAPEGWRFDNNFYRQCIEGSGNVLCKITLSRFNREKLATEFAALIVHNDFTTELIEDDPRKNLSFPAGSHNISDIMYDIYDADSGAVIVEGFNDTENGAGYGNMSVWYDYEFQIYNDRFVYSICGNERVPGFGYYDYNTGTAVKFPESKNFFPVGYHDGKVYAEQGVWDGMGQGELYTFDMETLGSEHFMSSPVELGRYDYTEYYMPQGGSYLIAVNQERDNENYENTKNNVLILSSESGEILARQEFSVEYDDCRFFTFMEDGRFAAFNYDTNEIVIFEVTE